MSVEWQRGDRDFGLGYDRDHLWKFDGGATIEASSAPSLMGNPALVDPEAAFVAAISSCHMLWFLFLAAKEGLTVDCYEDSAVGYMERDATGVTWITRVELVPRISFAPASSPSATLIRDLHDRSHHNCFIANSVRTQITVVRAQS
ncbi:MAG: OsmC family protein [Acidimicrobiales bacterium]